MYLAANVFIIAYAGVVILQQLVDCDVAVENLFFSVANFIVSSEDGALRALDAQTAGPCFRFWP